MATYLRPHTYFFIYLLILSYSWTITKTVTCELYLSVARTAQVMNSDLFSVQEHHHTQDAAQLDLNDFEASLDAEKQLPPQSKPTPAPKKKTVYFNTFSTLLNVLNSRSAAIHFGLRPLIGVIRQLPTPPPKFGNGTLLPLS